MEGIDRPHGNQVCTEFNQKAPHPIVPEPLKLEVVSGLANSSAFATYYNTLNTFFWSSLEQDSLLENANIGSLQKSKHKIIHISDTPVEYQN